MTSQQTGSLAGTVTTCYICSSCEKKGLRAFFVSKRAVHVHTSKCKGCSGSNVKQISVMTRPGDVIACGSGGMGQCPPQQHQPPGIIKAYTCIIPGLYQDILDMTDIFQIYTRYIPFLNGICLVMPNIILKKACHMTTYALYMS
jgi:hypothetical protein